MILTIGCMLASRERKERKVIGNIHKNPELLEKEK
ncbi:MAG: hypothetical protein IJ426_02280 [Clostridia bacterium]|nr:hypothetical protein [Clostridia bacterium]